MGSKNPGIIIPQNCDPSVRQAITQIATKVFGLESTPTFAGVSLSGLTASSLLQTDANKVLVSIANPLIVAKGGTGAATLTDHGILLGSGTNAVTPLGVAANGKIPIGSAGVDPVLAEITGTANQITSTPGAGTITLATPQDIHSGASPTFAGLTLTNAAIVSSDSVVLQPNTDSTTFFQILDADGGTPLFNIDTTNKRVGIGTATPGKALTVGPWEEGVITAGPDTTIAVYGDGQAYFIGRDVTNNIEFAFGASSQNEVFVGAQSNHGLSFRTGTIERMVLSYHTTSAYLTLFASANGDCGLTFDGDRRYTIQNDGNGSLGADDYLHIYDSTAGASRITIATSGNIGFGDAAPGTKVQIKGTEAYLTLQNSTNENGDGGAETRIIFEDHANVTLAQIQGSHDGVADDTKGDLIFSTHTGGALTEVLRLDSDQLATFSGNVIIPDAGYIGSASDTDAIQIEADGDVVLSQNLGIGVSPTVPLHIVADGSNADVFLYEYQGNVPGPAWRTAKARGSVGTPAALQDNDELGKFHFYGHDGTEFLRRTAILSTVDGAVSTGVVPTDLQFWTSSGGSPSLRITIDASGNTKIGDGGTTNFTTVAVDGSISQTGTARIDWTKVAANGVTLGDGPPTSGDTVSDLQTAFDGNTYTVDEDAASAGQNLIVDFTGVTAFNWVQILGWYDGQTGHYIEIQLEVSPFDDSTWHTYCTMLPNTTTVKNHGFFVPDDSAYINGGVVKIRFLHAASGNANDDWVFEEVSLYQ